MENGRWGSVCKAGLCHSLVLALFCLSASPSCRLQSLREDLLQHGLSSRVRCPSGHIHLLQHGDLHGLQCGCLLLCYLFHGLQVTLCSGAWSTTASPPSLPLLFRLLFLTSSPILCSLCGVFAHSKICLHRGGPSLAEELSCALWWGCCSTGWNRLNLAWDSPWCPLTEAAPAPPAPRHLHPR